MREPLQLTYAPLVEAQKSYAQSGSADPIESSQNALFLDMTKNRTLFGGALAGAGNGLGMSPPT